MAAIEAAALGALPAVPKASRWELVRALLSGSSERIDMRGRLQRLHAQYGPVVLLDLGLIKYVNLYGPDANRFVLLDKDRIFSARKPWMQIMGRIFPNGLLLRDGEEHKQHRKIMREAFTRPALREYGERMTPLIAAGLDGWRGAQRTFQAFPAYKALTLDIAARIFVGVELGPETTRMNGIFEDLVAASMSKLRLRIPGLEFHRGLVGREFMIRYFGGMLAARRAGGGSDMFSRLSRARSEEGAAFSDPDIIDHMVFLMMAAHDTTTSTLTSITYELARHPEWQERVREESRALGQDGVGFDDLDRLPTLSLVLKETLRLYPPLPVIPRVATESFEWGGYRVPRGAMVVIAPIHTHYMPEWWSEPTRFDPERFTPERAEDQRHTHSWVPFGGGPHLCLGMHFAEMQIKAIMHALVQRFRWSVPSGYRMPVQQAPISKPLDGLPIQLDALT
ncbi:MAG: cytochrome P450 [Deltaproteobacteria bacterium]|nr:cytochrome P450 [Deltaproteobacteria bacterium]